MSLTFNEFVVQTACSWHNHKQAGGRMRAGQYFMRQLKAYRPVIWNMVKGTWRDPYFDDRRLGHWLKTVGNLWVLKSNRDAA